MARPLPTTSTGRALDSTIRDEIAVSTDHVPPRKRQKITNNIQTPQSIDIQYWTEKQASHWDHTRQTRAREDEKTSSRYGDEMASVSQQVLQLSDEEEETIAQIKQKRHALKKKLQTLLYQYKKAKETVAAERKAQDEAAEAYFHRAMAKSDPPLSEGGKGHINQSVVSDSGPFTGQMTTAPAEQEEYRTLYTRRISVEDQAESQSIEAPSQRHVDVDLGSHPTMGNHRAVDDSTFAPPYRHSSGRHHPSPTGLSLGNKGLTTLLQYLTVTMPRLKPTNFVPVYLSHKAGYFWWDARKILEWTSFLDDMRSKTRGVGGSLLNRVVPVDSSPSPSYLEDSPWTEKDLLSIYTGWLLPRLNTALQQTPYPVQLGVSSTPGAMTTKNIEEIFVASMNPGGVCVVGLVKSSCRFNTSMRQSSTIITKYLLGLAHLHNVMRENSCRYGFIITETELVIVRNGTEAIPLFGRLEVKTCQLATNASNSIDLTGGAAEDSKGTTGSSLPIAPCHALWGLCVLACTTEARTEIGLPSKGTRRNAAEQESWMPIVHEGEEEVARRSRGWAFPEEPLSTKESGRKRMRYSA